MDDDPSQGRPDLTFELTCRRKAGRATRSTEGWIEGDPREISRLFDSGMLELSVLDHRLEGNAFISGDSSGPRCVLKGSGPITVEGRELDVGDRVRITRGGKILWYR